MKCTIFRLKTDPKTVYAYTGNRSYAEKFMEQRKKSLFYIDDISMEKYEWMLFTNKYSSKQLIPDYLNDGTIDIEIICTVEESDKLSESCEYIENTARVIREVAMQYPLKERFLNIISQLTDVIKQRDTSNPTLSVDTFKLFYHLFRYTFSEVPFEEDENF